MADVLPDNSLDIIPVSSPGKNSDEDENDGGYDDSDDSVGEGNRFVFYKRRNSRTGRGHGKRVVRTSISLPLFPESFDEESNDLQEGKQ